MLSLAKPSREKGTVHLYNAPAIIKTTSSKAPAISGTDVVFQILLHVPLKSLLIFKSVSKQWLSIISDPQFIREKHRIHHGSRLQIPGLFLKKDFCDSKNREYHYICMDGSVSSNHRVPFKTLNLAGEDQRIVASSNGLLLCKNYDTANPKYYVYNPFTRQYKILPPFMPPRSSRDDNRSLDIELAFDPLKSLYYKVICIWGYSSRSSNERRIEIYSSETSSWRRCEKTYVFSVLYDYYKSCVLWNGSMNWITNHGRLIYFNIEKETLGEVLSPRENNNQWYTDGSCLDVYGGHLLYLLMNCDVSTCFEVLEMDTNYTGWILKYKVDMEGLRVLYPILGKICSYKVIFIDEVDEFSPKFIVLIHKSDVIISYDSEKDSCTVLYDTHEWKSSQRWSPSVFKYVESLACV